MCCHIVMGNAKIISYCFGVFFLQGTPGPRGLPGPLGPPGQDVRPFIGQCTCTHLKTLILTINLVNAT